MSRLICMDCRSVYGVTEQSSDSHGLCPICMTRRMASVASYRPNNFERQGSLRPIEAAQLSDTITSAATTRRNNSGGTFNGVM